MMVSVCLPVYNGARYIRQAVASVLDQTYEDIELVVVDNASTDATLDELRSFESDPRLRVLTSTTTVPAGDNWNRAIGEARGELVKLLCADDLLTPTCLDRQVEALRAEPTVTLVAAQRQIIDTKGKVLRARRGLGRLDGVVPGAQAIRACVRAGTNLLGEPAAVLMRRTALQKVGPFDPRYAYVIDMELWCRLLSVGPLVAIREPLAQFRVHRESWSSSLTKEQSRQARELLRQLDRQHGAVTKADLRAGLIRAGVNARARRLAYWLWLRGSAETVVT